MEHPTDHGGEHSVHNSSELQNNSAHDEGGQHDAHSDNSSADSISLNLSKYAKSLISAYTHKNSRPSLSANKISVSQTVSFFAFLYEKMRNAVEFREEHLIRRAAIERIIKRRMLMNENGREIAEPLVKELLWARYYENNTIGEDVIAEIQSIIDKYFFIRNEISSGRSSGEKEKIANFFLEILSCEVEDLLSPNNEREAFTNFVYQMTRRQVAPFNGNDLERDIQVYIAVERAFAHNDDPLIRYNLLKLMVPEITQMSWKSSDKYLPKLYESYQDIEKALLHPFADKTRNFVKKQKPPYLILQDLFSQNKNTLNSILSNEQSLKHKVDTACRRRYEETKDKLRRAAIRSFIYIILTKVIFAFILEVPYDLYLVQKIEYIPLIINILFPPFLMALIILTVSIPGDENTRRIFKLIKNIVTTDPDNVDYSKTQIAIGKHRRIRNPVIGVLFTALYFFTYLISFGGIIYLLTLLKFNPVSQAIFIFFVTLVTFFAYRVINITQEYLVVEKEGPFSTLSDFFFLPVIRVGRWLSGEVLTKFNVFIFVFDFIIEMPLKAIVEVFDEWVHFVRLKKEEIV